MKDKMDKVIAIDDWKLEKNTAQQIGSLVVSCPACTQEITGHQFRVVQGIQCCKLCIDGVINALREVHK